MNRIRIVICLGAALGFAGPASADQAGRRHAENELHALPAVRITVGHDHRPLQAAANRIGNIDENDPL